MLIKILSPLIGTAFCLLNEAEKVVDRHLQMLHTDPRPNTSQEDKNGPKRNTTPG